MNECQDPEKKGTRIRQSSRCATEIQIATGLMHWVTSLYQLFQGFLQKGRTARGPIFVGKTCSVLFWMSTWWFHLVRFFFTSEPRSKSLVADIMYIIIVYIYISKYTFCSKGTSSGMTHTCMVHRNYINHETIQSLLRTHSHVKLIRRGWVRSGQARQLAQKKARVHHHRQRLGIGVSAWRPLKAMW